MKTIKRKKVIFFSVIILVLIPVLIFTFYSSNKNEINFSKDIGPINSRFPKLKDIQKVYWSSQVINKDFGPTSYWMRGYVFLDDASALDIKETYSWEAVNLKPKMEYDFKDETQSWAYSEDFNTFIKSSNYMGNFFLDLNGNSLYFEIEQ